MTEVDAFSKFSRTDSIRANLKQRSIRGAVFMASGNAADMLLRMVSIAILARLLPPADFGLVAMVMALTAVLDGLKDFGLSTATVQRAEITHSQVSNLFWANVAVGIFLASAFCAFSPLIAAFFSEARLIDISLALSITFIWNGLAVQHEALMLRQLRQGELAAIRLLATMISVVAAVSLALEGWGYWSLVLREIARSAIIAGGVWLRCRWTPGLPTRGVGTRSLIRFGGEISLSHLLVSLINNIEKLLVGRFFGASVVGMYRQAQVLVLTPIEHLNGPIVGVAQPALSALQIDPARYRRFYEKIVFIVSLLIVPIGLLTAVCADEITLLILGPSWTDAAVFIRIFGVAAAIRPVIGTNAVVLITCGQSTRFLLIAIIHSALLAMLLTVGLNWGATGVAVASVATSVALMYPKLYYSFLKSPATIGGFFSAAQSPAISGLVMVAGLIVISENYFIESALPSLIFKVISGSTIYLLAMWLQPNGRSKLKALRSDIRAALEGRNRPTTALETSD